MRKWLLMISSLASAAVALAQQGAEPAPDPLYHVELIVYSLNEANRLEEDFHHGDEAAAPVPELYRLPEIELESVFEFSAAPIEVAEAPEPLAEPELPDAPPALELIERSSSRTRPETLPDGFRVLARDELELGDVRASLNRSRLYTVLGHAGWAQSGVDTDRSVPLNLKRLGIGNPQGTIEISLRRFLRVALEFDYVDGRGTFWSRSAQPPPAPLSRADSYPLSAEITAIRSGELHYVDFPLFGVLIRIVPAPEPDTEADSAGGRGPAG